MKTLPDADLGPRAGGFDRFDNGAVPGSGPWNSPRSEDVQTFNF